MRFDLPCTATPRLTIPSHAVPPETAHAARVRFGDAAETGFTSSGEASAAFLANGCDREALAEALHAGASHVVELTEDAAAQGLWLGTPALGKSFYLSLTTSTAMTAQPAIVVCDQLTMLGVLNGERRPSVELCLHEAVANAVMHGNLGLSSSAKEQPEGGYRTFSLSVNERLHDPALRRRRVDIFVRWTADDFTLSVADEGDGFDVAGLRLKPEGAARSGRGFLFMRALTDGLSIGDDGRCTTLRFDR
jgi:hypothetical protein